MTQEEYIKERIDDQIGWYEKKSAFCQKKHKFWQVTKIIAALLITCLSLWATSDSTLSDGAKPPFVKVSHIIGILGAFLVFVESFVKIFDYEKLWIQYRGAAEGLKREKLLFQTGTAPYDNADAFSMLVQQSEAIMKNEVQGWVKLREEKDKEKENDQNQ